MFIKRLYFFYPVSITNQNQNQYQNQYQITMQLDFSIQM
jgi:hypothetical protein